MHDLKAIMREQRTQLRHMGVHPQDIARILEPIRACIDGRHDYGNHKRYDYEDLRHTAPKHANTNHRNATARHRYDLKKSAQPRHRYESPRATTRRHGVNRIYD